MPTINILQRVFGCILCFTALTLTGCSLLEEVEITAPLGRESKYGYYDSIPEASKSVLLYEQFTTNARQWRQETDAASYRMQVENGTLVMRAQESDPQPNTIAFPALSDSGNFEIEAYLDIAPLSSGPTGTNNVLVWGATADEKGTLDQWQYMGLDYMNDQTQVGAYNGKKHITDWYRDSWGSGYNKITVRKVDKVCYYFVNKYLVATRLHTPFFGNRLGFGVDQHSEVRVDYLKVSRLKVK